MYRIVPRTAAAVAITAAAATAAVALAGPAGATTATSAEVFAYGGNAYGSHVALGTLANVGKTAYTPMCTTDAGARHLNKTAAVDLGTGVGYIGAVTSKMVSKHKGSTSSSNASTHTATTKLFGGMVRLNAVTTAATVSHAGSKYSMSGGSTFLGLTIAGQSFPATPKANSSYSLPGLGSLTLNEQRFGTRKGIPTATVIAVDIKLGTSNALGLPTGRIVIGQSTASLLQTHRVPTGAAWATSISVSSLVDSNRTAAAYTGCGGTASKGNSTNDLLGLSLPSVGTLGVAKSTVHTHDTAAKTTSVSRNRIAGANLFNGMIKVKALATQANATADAKGHRTRTSTGTSVLGLVIAGQAVAAPPLGQQQSIPGLGSLTFGYSHKTKNGGIVVYGLRLVLGTAQGNLPIGAVITIGAARANASV